MQRPFVIGVTGGIACGKSTVMRMLADLGAETIDADVVYHELIAPGRPLWHALRSHFGDGIIGRDGSVDRRALASIVFSDPAALADLDRLTHPAVNTEIIRRIAESAVPSVAVDAVKLVESGFDAECDRVWIVTCGRDQQVERLMARNGLSRSDAERRVDAQGPPSAGLARADAIIDNSDGLEKTRAQVRAAWSHLPSRSRA